MLGSIAFLIFCIQFVAEGFLDLVFPYDNLQFQLLNWIDCETKEKVKLVDVDGQQQLRLQKGIGFCLDLNNLLLVDEDYTYIYTFILNRPLNQDELNIFIDYKLYNLSKIINAQPFFQIQHHHFLTCKNQIELWWNSNEILYLFFLYIAKVQTNTYDQVLLVGQLPDFDYGNKFFYDFHLSLEQEFKNGTLYYQTLVQQSQDEYSQLYWFKLYLNYSPLAFSISELNSSLIQGSKNIVERDYQKLHNLEFMIKTQYQIRQFFILPQNYQTIEFEAITQIDDSFSSLAFEDTLFKKKFKKINQIRMLVQVQQKINQTNAIIIVQPKNYNNFIQNINLNNAKINIKNDIQETVLECYFTQDDQKETCLNYNSTSFSFQVKWSFENNTQYSYELSGTLMKVIDDDPFIFFQTDVEYFPIINIENSKLYWIGYLLLIYLLLPTFIYIFCVLCILSLKPYHPYIMYIIETDETCFQPKRKDNFTLYNSTLQQQQSEEVGQLNQSKLNE